MIRGSVVLVTGGGTGLGLALVERLVREGAKVGVLDRSAQRLDALIERFDRSQVVTVCGDVTDLDANFAAVDHTLAAFGKLDTFVGNAALWDFSTSLLDLPKESIGSAFDEIFGVNVKGYLFGARAAASALLETRGSMVFSLSNAALYAGGGGPLYTASKHAGVGLVRQLAYELSPKVRVNAVAPTAMATELTGPQSLNLHERRLSASWDGETFAKRVPLEFKPQPSDYLGAYLYLMDHDLSPTVTGTVSVCDMGLGIRGIRDVAGGRNL
jgi:NAD(P)-dependent dehydrogenase (short-subunit alcohol dehydrogenase family)